MSRYECIFLILSGFFISSLIIANCLVFKFFDIPLPFSFSIGSVEIDKLTLSLGILPYPITFLCTDLVCELYGKKRAGLLVLIGFVMSLYLLFFLMLGQPIPVSSVQDPVIQDHYNAVFGLGTRAIFASMVAYLLAQLLDVHLFHFWKRLTKGRHLWLRNNGSTIFSQLVDTVAVITILFIDTMPFDTIVAMIVSGYLFKLFVALLDTPLFYLGARLFEDIAAETRAREARVPS